MINFIDLTSKFVGIFEKNNEGDYILSDIAFVDYDMCNDEFEVETGKFAGNTNQDFNRIENDPDSLFFIPSQVDIDHNDTISDKLIMIFENDYVDSVIVNKNVYSNEIEKFHVLTSKLGELKIHENLDGSLYTKAMEVPICYSLEEVEDKLYNGNQIGKPIEKENDGFDNVDDDKHVNTFDSFLGALFGIRPLSIHPINTNIRYHETEYDEFIDDLDELKEKYKKIKEEKKIHVENINPNDVISKTSSKIVGQEFAIRTLVNQIFNNQKIIEDVEKEGDFDVTELDARKTSILLDGETGTGKTAILKDVAKQLGLPIVIASATNFSATGYVGASVTDLLRELLDQSEGDIEKAERGIIVFDEVDKLAFSKESVLGIDMREEVQHELLSLISGGEYDISMGGLFSQKQKFNTSKNTFILSGAFTDLREEKIKEVDKSHQAMGFSTVSSDNYEREYIVSPDDYIKYGLMREFFGRIKVLVSTKSYNIDDYKDILTKSLISPLLNFEKNVKIYGYPGISYNEEFLNRVAEEGMKMKTGARGIQTVMSGIQNNLLGALINGEFDKDKPIELDVKMIDDYNKLFIRKY